MTLQEYVDFAGQALRQNEANIQALRDNATPELREQFEKDEKMLERLADKAERATRLLHTAFQELDLPDNIILPRAGK